MYTASMYFKYLWHRKKCHVPIRCSLSRLRVSIFKFLAAEYPILQQQMRISKQSKTQQSHFIVKTKYQIVEAKSSCVDISTT